MPLFSSKPADVVVQGGSVTINEGSKTPEQRYKRARSRVDNLQNKLRRLKDGRYDQNKPEVKVSIANTEKAVEEWRKRMLVAQFEIKIQKGEV
jgi:hypothetical protein